MKIAILVRLWSLAVTVGTSSAAFVSLKGGNVTKDDKTKIIKNCEEGEGLITESNWLLTFLAITAKSMEEAEEAGKMWKDYLAGLEIIFNKIINMLCDTRDRIVAIEKNTSEETVS